ncbi:MAG: hypothetical protein J0H74_35365 [Chitinophagaceae bacterium]|nr:hypothetical protein [Chitinophagaceae bacterium]
MRRPSITLILLGLLSFSSCTTYQYITLGSPEVAQDASKSLTWENDTMRLTYNFHGEGGPISITLANKMDKPLFVNWTKSALIRDGQAFSLMDRNVQISGAFAGASVGGRGFRYTGGGFSGSLQLPEGVDLVPPGAHIAKNLNAAAVPSAVYSDKFMDKTQAQEKKVVLSTGGGYKYKQYSFDQSSSPVQFKSYLTFSLANSTEEFFVSHSFYAREILLSEEVPDYFTFYQPDGDKLFVKLHNQ